MHPPFRAMKSLPRMQSCPLSITMNDALNAYEFRVKVIVARPLTTTSWPFAERNSTCGGLRMKSTAASSGKLSSTCDDITLFPEPESAIVDNHLPAPIR